MTERAYRDILRREFAAEDGSFLLQLRVDLVWDRAAFGRLTEAMRLCCEQHTNAVAVERWLTDGYWYLYTFVPGHTLHPSFPRPFAPAYYERAYQRLWDLAEWFFSGSRPYAHEAGFEPL
jgi:hypothetical protein